MQKEEEEQEGGRFNKKIFVFFSPIFISIMNVYLHLQYIIPHLISTA